MYNCGERHLKQVNEPNLPQRRAADTAGLCTVYHLLVYLPQSSSKCCLDACGSITSRLALVGTCWTFSTATLSQCLMLQQTREQLPGMGLT